MESVLIVGGGVSGLATAYFLSRYAISSTVVEKSSRTGGLIRTDLIDGCRLEAGPDSYLAAKPAVTELAAELPGLKDQIIGSNDEARRIFVVRNGQLIQLPKGMVMMVPGEWEPLRQSELLSDAAKKRVHSETKMKPRERSEDVSVGRFVEEHFGSEVLEYLAEPLLCGVYGGDSRNLSAESVLPRFVAYERKYGSLIKGVHEELRANPRHGSLFLSLRDGMQALTDSLAGAMAGRVNFLRGEATEVKRDVDGWTVKVSGEILSARDVVLACPAHVSATLLENAVPPLADDLADIPYSSAILVTLVYDRARLGHPLEGFGFLVPRAERQTLAAATWVSTKFPTRIRPGLAALRAFIVGDRARELADASEAEIVSLVRADYRRLMGIEEPPLFHTYYSWPKSMPQYVVGHSHRVSNMTETLKDYPGLFLGGNAYDGVGIPDCIRRAEQTAQQICQKNV